MQRVARMKKEMQIFQNSPPHGISCWPKGDSIENLEAQIVGGDGTPYEGGVFKLEITVPERYPFEPPKVRFVTPIYHPNIDNAGRICLDSLKMPPKGAWKPALNLSTVLISIQLLMAEPNPEDPLIADISNEFKYNKPLFTQKAKQWTEKHAKQEGKENTSSTANVAGSSGQQQLKSTDQNPLKKKLNSQDNIDSKKPKVTV